MGNRPQRHYDYSSPGVAMLTLKARPNVWFCRITQESFSLTDFGRIVQKELLGIPGYFPQLKIGQYQIMPDHVHAMAHVVKPLPDGVTLQRVFRGFKLGVNQMCAETLGGRRIRVFEKGMYDSLVFNREHLQREVDYIRDNVRRYRLRKANPELFRRGRCDAVAGGWDALMGLREPFFAGTSASGERAVLAAHGGVGLADY